MKKIKISAVSYLNTKPFIYGLKNSDLINRIDLSLDIPSECARKLAENEVDIGLTPIVSLLEINNSTVISDYCIGASNKVKSVLLVSKSPIHTMKKIYMDYHSRTSVLLARVLALKHWRITPEFIPYQTNIDYDSLNKDEAAVIIGDKTFELENHFEYKYDLAEEWIKLTGLPFVFAAWISNKNIDPEFIAKFNTSLKYGIDHINEVIDEITSKKVFSIDIKNYLNNNISFLLDQKKQDGMSLFLNYVKEFNNLK